MSEKKKTEHSSSIILVRHENETIVRDDKSTIGVIKTRRLTQINNPPTPSSENNTPPNFIFVSESSDT
jgi:hypothetical protein